jgi:predicted phosphodiesterase
MALIGDIVKEYLKRFPKTPSLTLAKKIYKENIEVFKNVEHARDIIRTYRGSHGDLLREKIKDRTFYNQIPELPKSEKVYKPTYVFPKANNRILVISDIHCPYQDNEALEAALNYGVERKANTVLINGDLIDFYHISRFEKDPRKRNTKYEIDCTKKVLEYIRYKFPTALIVYYMGNHDHRWTKYMMNKAPELLDIEEFSIYHILGLQKLNIHLVDNNRGTKAGKLNIRHGHEFYGSGGVLPARYYYLKAKDNILIGHVHKTSNYATPNINKKIHGGFSIGCLSDLDPDYNPNNECNHGFAHVEIKSNGDFKVDNKQIINGEVL